MKRNSLSRRAFIAAAPAVLSAAQLGANERVRIGVIGTGERDEIYTLEPGKQLEMKYAVTVFGGDTR